MNQMLADVIHEFRHHKRLADSAMTPVADANFFRRPAEQVNSIALVVKHLGGNLQSRWSEFLSTDGEKPTRNRDAEFVIAADDTREKLLASWETGWQMLFDTLAALTDADLPKIITIRGEPHTALQAILRGLTHAAYHTGQILYLARLWQPDAPWLTIAPGQSPGHRPGYRQSQ